MQERKIYVFGGWDTPVCYNDMYMLDLGKPSYMRTKGTFTRYTYTKTVRGIILTALFSLGL